MSDKYEGEFTKQDEYVALEMSHLAPAGLENVKLLEEIGHLNTGLEQKVVERNAALVRQEALLRALAEQAPQMVWTASPEGRATYYNHTWFDLMGGTLKDWAGYQWLAAIHPEDVASLKDAWATSRENQTLSLMARKLLDEWKTREPERQVTVKVEKGLQAHGDERLLRVVMENLLANAWKFTAQSAQAEIRVGQQSDLAGLPVFFYQGHGRRI